jgi:hypothetical protein
MKQRFTIGTKYEYCPNGNYWQDISGIFDREIFLFCDCDKCGGQVYVLRARKFKLDDSRLKEVVADLRERDRLEEVRQMITPTNMNKVAQRLTEAEQSIK